MTTAALANHAQRPPGKAAAAIDAVLVDIRNVSFRYVQAAPWTLRNVSLQVSAGEHIGIVGANGSGKSTIAKLLLGLHQPQQGCVELFGQQAGPSCHYPTVGYIGDPSHQEGLLGLPTDLRMATLIDAYKELFTRSRSPLPLLALEQELGLDDAVLRSSEIGTFSRGQRQRLMAFLALAKAPALLIADEATEGLDHGSRAALVRTVKHLTAHGNMAILWISHRFEEVLLLTSRIYELREGILAVLPSQEFACALDSNHRAPAAKTMSAGALLGLLGSLLADPTTTEVNVSIRRNPTCP